MTRREVIALGCWLSTTWLSGAAAQTAKVPIIAVLSAVGAQAGNGLAAIRQGLEDEGFYVGQNVELELHGAGGQLDRLPAMAADLVSRGVAVLITTGGNAPAFAARAATATIPIVFTVGDDPTEVGLVASLNRPGGNATGISLYSTELLEKRLEILRELTPNATTVAMLVGGGDTSLRSKDQVENAAFFFGLKVSAMGLLSEDGFEALFAAAAKNGADALLVAAAPFFLRRRAQIVALAARYGWPAIYPWREFPEAGGLMSYGPVVADAYRLAGQYAGRILKGASPGELPVQLPTRFEFVINLKTARTLGLTIPRLLNARADKVIY